MKYLKYKKGFSLVELLLYISIASILLLAISVFFSFLLRARIKNQVIAEVEQQGLSVMHLMTQTTRNAEAIILPVQSVSAPSLSLQFPSSSIDPTFFDLSSGSIRIKEASGIPVSLTNSRITASALQFQNLSRTNTPGIIRIQFTLTSVNPGGRSEYSYSKTFIGSAALR